MDRKYEGGKSGAEMEGLSFPVRYVRNSQAQQAQSHKIKDHGVGCVQEEIGQMIPKRVHAPDNVIHAQCEPTQRLIMALMKSGKHQAKLGPAQAPVVRVFKKVFVV